MLMIRIIKDNINSFYKKENYQINKKMLLKEREIKHICSKKQKYKNPWPIVINQFMVFLCSGEDFKDKLYRVNSQLEDHYLQ